jgi:V-type H+-transporting ATPase subunit a
MSVEPEATSLFRSKPMLHMSITMTQEAAERTIRELGHFAKFHFIDLNTRDNPSKQAVYYKKRVQEIVSLEKRFEALERQMESYNVELPPPLRAIVTNALPDYRRPELKDPDADIVQLMKTRLDEMETDLKRSIAFQQENRNQICNLSELKAVLSVMRQDEFKQESRAATVATSAAHESKSELLPTTSSDRTGLSKPLLDQEPVFDTAPRFRTNLVGVIPQDNVASFQRMIYRVCRNNAYFRFFPIENAIKDPANPKEGIYKSVFYVSVLGQQLERRMRKLCQIFQAKIHNVPQSGQDLESQLARIEAELRDKSELERTTEREIMRMLEQLAGTGGGLAVHFSPLREHQDRLRQEKLVCDTMQKCRFFMMTIVAEGWCPVECKQLLLKHLSRAVEGTQVPMPAIEINPPRPIKKKGTPPTFFFTDKFTGIFQNIVNTYGTPRYQEANPGLFTIVTFPFLFGVMFGDIGHGFFLALASLLIILREKTFEAQKNSGQMNEIFRMCYSGRYMLFMMGCCGIYCGTIYNDCMSIPVYFYDSAYTWYTDNSTTILQEVAYKEVGSVYPYGVDPHWYHTKNQLLFMNSMKMKLSVTIGVIQMTFGIVMSLLNHIHFGDYAAIFLQFIPQLLFMVCTFGYMVIIIIIKYCIDWRNDREHQSPPNLIQTMIGMFLKLGGVEAGSELYDGQSTVQGALLAVAVLAIPVMLFGKPLYVICTKKGHGHGGQDDHGAVQPVVHGEHKEEKKAEDKSKSAEHEEDGGEEHHSTSDLMIHSGIHTIEFVLGTVSNTASYLRLWALSLAHSELAEVFWTKLIEQYGFQSGSVFMSFVTFAAWAGITTGVLLMMDVLECFLHALRLHWVEFQNKFFYADGVAFRPFTFDLSDDGDD